MEPLWPIRPWRLVGWWPTRLSFERNLVPDGATISPSGDRVVKQMFFAIIVEGYMDLKSRTHTQWYRPGLMSCTYPPSIWSPSLTRLPICGTATSARSAARIRSESASCEEPEVRTSSSESLDTAARSIPFLRVSTFSSTRRASSASLVQYSSTLSLFSLHSRSMWRGSTSSFVSPRSSLETAFSVSCFGRISLLTAHQASQMILPLTRQNLSLLSLGCPPSLPHGRASFMRLAFARSSILRMS